MNASLHLLLPPRVAGPIATLALGAVLHALPAPVAFRVAPKVPDQLEPGPLATIRLTGFLEQRVRLNAEARLAQVDLEPLLAGFRHKPGSHPWIGEHLGKWMHAATLAWANNGDVELERKIAGAVAELIKAQEPDGYLGTYVPEKRFGLFEGADWDVWSHKYCLLGLLTWYQYTGNADALTAAQKAGDLLLATFGPGRKSILAAGTHVGMAATSVLEPMVLLYRFTGERRYLEFARYLVSSWDEANGPAILKTLLAERNVHKTANGKAYEMLSNLVGLCELYRATGEKDDLRAVLNAWEDIVANRLYLTGSASQGEHFRDDHDLPNGMGAHVAETCVTTTWIQLNSQLLRLTGEARFGDELERTFYNHLAAAQHPAGSDWCYFTPLEGRKQYLKDINCCHSSGPRGIALIAPNACFLAHPGTAGTREIAVVLNLVELAEAQFTVGSGSRPLDAQRGRDFPSRFDTDLVPVADASPVNVRLQAETGFPTRGQLRLALHPERPVAFALHLRAPSWAGRPQATVNEKAVRTTLADGWLRVAARRWQEGDRLEITHAIEPRLITGVYGNTGKAALAWGPFVLAFDQALNPGLPIPARIALAAPGESPVVSWRGPAVWPLQLEAQVVTDAAGDPRNATWIPFADASSSGSRFAVWVRAPGVPLPENSSLFAFAEEQRSQPGNAEGSITDGDPESYVVTFNGRPQEEAWFAVQASEPRTIRRVVFAHGRSFHDGGWFDSSRGKPRVEVKRTSTSDWEVVGELTEYPDTTAAQNPGLRPGQQFTLRLAAPVPAAAIRVVGKPASGDNPGQAFASCGELEAHPD